MGVQTTITTFTTPGVNTQYLQKVEFSGSNIAQYGVSVNSNLMSIRRTNFGASLDGEVSFLGTPGSNGFLLSSGDVVTISVIHERPYVGDFFARIQTLGV